MQNEPRRTERKSRLSFLLLRPRIEEGNSGKQQGYVLGVVVWHSLKPFFFYLNSIYGSKVSVNTTACSKASHTRSYREHNATIYNSVTRSLSLCMATKLCWWRHHIFLCERPKRILYRNILTTNCDFEFRCTVVSFLVLSFDLHLLLVTGDSYTCFRFMWPCVINVGEERTNRWHKYRCLFTIS